MDRFKSIIKRLKDLTTVGVANIITSAIGGIFWFYIASLVGVENYGEISYFIAIAGIAGVISFLGAGTTITVYTAKGEKIESAVFSISIISSIITSTIVFFIFYNLGASLYSLGFVIFGLATSELLGKKLYRNYSIAIITQRILMVALAVSFYVLLGSTGVILGIALSFFPYSIRLYHGFKSSKIDYSVVKSKWTFMMNNYILDLSRTFSGSIDKLIIAPLFGFTLLGNYQLGVQFLAVLALIPNVVYQYVLPQDASGKPKDVLKKATILVSILLLILGVLLAPLVVPLLFPKFTDAVEVVQIMSFAIIPASINLMYISKFLGRENSKIVLISSGISIITQILGMVLLGQLLGIKGVAIAYVLGASLEALFLVAVNKRIKYQIN